MPPRKRKSEAAAVADGINTSSAKRTRKPIPETAAANRPRRSLSQKDLTKVGASSVATTPSKTATTSSAAAATGARAQQSKEIAAKAFPSVVTAPVPEKNNEPVRRQSKKQKVAPKQSLNGTSNRKLELPTEPVAVQETGEEADDEEDDEDDDRSYWLMKAEPESRFENGVDVRFSIDDLRAAQGPEAWDGVRNPLARNNMRAMKKGDYAFFYHSNCKVPGIAGIMEIVREHSVDESAFDPAHPYFDPKSSRDRPKWDVVHVEFRRKFKKLITLNELRSYAKHVAALEDLQMLRQSRLSVSAVTGKQWKFIMGMVEDESEDIKPKDAQTAEAGIDEQTRHIEAAVDVS